MLVDVGFVGSIVGEGVLLGRVVAVANKSGSKFLEGV